MFLGVIFDMDGLMLDTERIALALLAETAAALALPWSDAAGLGMVGLNERDSDAWLLQYFGSNYPVVELRKAFNARYQARVRQGPLPLRAGLPALLEWLSAERIPAAVATSTRRALACEKLERAGIGKRFVEVIGGDQVARGKPAPDIYLAAAQALGFAPADCAALEDSEAGLEAALAAGCRAILVPDLKPPTAAAQARGAPIAATLHEAQALLAAWRASGGASAKIAAMNAPAES
jgi:HAD superfamily hydrolase (TIGR01509 family)